MSQSGQVKPLLVSIYPDAAAALGVGRTKVFDLVKSGELPTVRIGRRRLVPAAALEEYAASLWRNR